jgi:hypothetical protein
LAIGVIGDYGSTTWAKLGFRAQENITHQSSGAWQMRAVLQGTRHINEEIAEKGDIDCR